MTRPTWRSRAFSRIDVRIRFLCVLVSVFLRAAPGWGQDSEIMVPAPVGGGPEIWVDTNPTGNTATSVASIQRCKKVDAGNAIFNVDVVVYNAPAYQKMQITLTFDSAYVQVIGVDEHYNLFRSGGTACNPTPWWVAGNTVTVYQWTTMPFGGSGNGVLFRVTFEGKAPHGQSGFDVTFADLSKGAGTTCFNGVWESVAGVSSANAIGQAYIDPTGVVGCWTVTSNGDAVDIAPGNGICDVNPAPGIVESTLRAAIQEANAIAGANRNSFRIPDQSRSCGTPCTIACPDLPALSDATGGTTLDGSTHTGIVLNAFGGTTDGLLLTSANNVVKYLTIQRAQLSGVKINGANGNKVLGCKIGTNFNGLGGARNNQHGVEIVNGSNNEVGGVNPGEGNIIVDHALLARFGVRITGGSGNLIRGNRIGLDANGARLQNFYGMLVIGSSGNTIGGAVAGARNIISGNAGHGIIVTGGAANNLIQGNYIGTDPGGTLNRFNGFYGISVETATNTTIGGTTGAIGDPPGNVISGNSTGGIVIAAASSGNAIRGNLIGLDINGNPLANVGQGVRIQGSSNTVGGSVEGDGNAISSNTGTGVEIQPGATGNQVQGNIIGLDDAGLLLRPNQTGVAIGGSGNTVGGSTTEPGTAPGNLISGNQFTGVSIGGPNGEGDNTVAGNVIGLDVLGVASGNGTQGVRILESPNNTIGGATANHRNVISDNGSHGVFISGASGNQVRHNYIGTGMDGATEVPNVLDGVRIEETPAAAANEHGETSSPRTALAPASGNVIADDVISGNLGDGVAIVGEDADNNSVLRCAIGTNEARDAEVPNTGDGVNISGGADGNQIGTPGNGNVISGNDENGVEILDAGTAGNLVRSNLIGLDGTGNTAIPNQFGVEIHLAATFNEIGGTLVGEGNVISGNDSSGVQIIDVGTDNNRVELNTIGTNAARNTAVPNNASGVRIREGAQFNTVVDNAIEGNEPHGVHLFGSLAVGTAARNEILSNFIGSISLPNAEDGVHVGPLADLNQVTLNSIGNNEDDGIEIQGEESDGNMVFGNSVIGHGASGVRISDDADDNVIGGFIPLSRNLIRGNTEDGIVIESGTGNALYENSISLNGELGIDLDDDDVTPNDGAPDADTGANELQNCPVLTGVEAAGGMTTAIGTLTSAPDRVYRIEFFSDIACDASGSGEGNTFIDFAFVTTDGTGTANIFQVMAGAPFGALMTATATDTVLHNTSEFSQCVVVEAGPGAPADLVLQNDSAVLTSAPRWFTSTFDTVAVGDTLSYSLVATNAGPGEATLVAVTDTLPDGVTFVSSVSSQGTCTGTSVVSCDVGTMAVDDTVTITIKVIPNAPGTIVNLAEIFGAEEDPDSTNNVARDTTVVESPTGVEPPPPTLVAERVWLGQNIPNPFNPSTRIPFSLPGAAVVRLAIYNVQGQLVRVLVDGARPAGDQAVVWDGRDRKGQVVSSGAYFYSLDSPWGRSARRMLLLK